MPRLTTQYVCQQCGYNSLKWVGQCPECGSWNTMVETVVSKTSKQRTANSAQKGSMTVSDPVILSNVKKAEYEKRMSTGIAELDRVLGGGIVSGMVTLIAGEPGIGKSTLLLQVANSIGQLSVLGGQLSANGQSVVSKSVTDKQKTDKLNPEDRKQRTDKPVIYIAGEESATQIANRASRLGIKGENIQILEETDVDLVIGQISQMSQISLIIIDSIQTLTTSDLTGTAGSVGQVRECAQRLTSWAKRNNVPAFFVGHVTREGTIAGPRVLEHMVDTVLWFEGERREFLRLIRGIKNRFGPTDEVGIFSMEEKGLAAIDPSKMMMDHTGVSGSCLSILIEGTRPMLVEIQALVAPTKLAFPKRSSSGIDARRLELIVAVLSRRVGLPLWEYDIFVNVAGGLKIGDPASDLAVAMAIASAFFDKPIRGKLVAVGEVGLLGEIREVIQLGRRIKEAERLGFKTVVSSKIVKTASEAINKYIK